MNRQTTGWLVGLGVLLVAGLALGQTPEEQLVTDLKELSEAATGADGATVMWAAVLAAVFKVVISGMKMTATWQGWWRGKKAKLALRLTTVTLGFVTFLLAHIALGKTWLEAFILGLAGPGAVVIHEYSKFFAGDKD